MTENLQAALIRDLVMESNEALEEFDADLLLLEKQQSSPETLNHMFRVIHSLKGTSGCLGLSRIESLAHAGENLLSLLREGEIEVSQTMINTLLGYADALRQMLRNLSVDGAEGADNHSGLLRDLHSLAQVTSQKDSDSHAVFGLFADDEPAPSEMAQGEDRSSASGDNPAAVTQANPSGIAGAVSPAASSTHPAAPETAIRVDVAQLDGMMDLVGELVLARNQIMQFTGKLDDSGLIGATQRLNIITTKLQETVMKTRMQPIGNVWSKFPRIVRDVSRELGKQVELVLEGKDTDLDRNIIEAIKDPLTHLIRNSVDHGIETPTQRLAAGKSATGILRLRAFHEGGQVNIEVYDDGGGIDRDKVLKRAIQKGLIQPAQAAQLGPREICSLIFAPGFSTAEKVTNVSGRGVGMDVVKNNVERIGGSVDVDTELGRSTTVRIKIPLTLAIIPALIIRCGNRRYAIPQVSLIELVRIESDNASHLIEYINGSPVYRLRGNLLPLVSLRKQLEIPEEVDAQESVFLLVLQAEGRQFGLIVDSISDTEEIVVKPLGKELKSLTMYAGATIMGDGCVALILDVMGIARRANVVEESNHIDSLLLSEGEKGKAENERQSLLLFSLGLGRQAAIPLSCVARLEEFAPSDLEWAGNSEVVQYRGEIMPLVRVNRVLNLPEPVEDEHERIRVVAYNHHGLSVGLIVHRILDTVDEAVSIQSCTNRPGILGAGVVKKRVTEFLDIDAILTQSEVVTFVGAKA